MLGVSRAIGHHSAASKPHSSTSSRLAVARGSSPGSSFPAGQLDEVLAVRIPVLALEQDRLRILERQHHHRAGMHDVLAPSLAAIGQAHLVAHDLQQPPW
jgi:hypothetical protein